MADVKQEHYRKLAGLGAEPFKVLQAWLTPDEFRGYMKGSAIVYLARERLKNRDDDVAKATHHLLRLLEAIDTSEPAPPFPVVTEEVNFPPLASGFGSLDETDDLFKRSRGK